MEIMTNEHVREHLKKLGFSIWVENINPDDPSFAELRMKGFGASDSAALLGVSPFKDITELMKEKKHHIIDESISKKASVRKGKDLEDLLIQKVSSMIDLPIIKPTDMFGDNESGLTVNFDGVANIGDQLIPEEIKVCTFFGRKYYDFEKSIYESGAEDLGKPFNDKGPATGAFKKEEYIQGLAAEYGIPVYYFTQIQQQMYFLDAPHGFLNVMDDHTWTLHRFKIYRHQTVIDKLIEIAKERYLELQIFRGEIETEYEDF